MPPEDFMKYLNSRLDKFDEVQDALRVDMAAVKTDLREHMRRTTLLETAVLPLQEHVAVWGAVAKWGAVIVGVLGSTAGVLTLILRLMGRL